MIFQWVRYRADLQGGDIKGIFLLKRNAFLGFHVTSASSFFPLRSPFRVTLHKKSSWKKSLLLKTGQWNEQFCLERNRVMVWRSLRHTSTQASPLSPFPLPTSGADTSRFRQYCPLLGWQISLINREYSILNQTNFPVWTGYRLDPQAGPRHVRFTEVSRERTQLGKRICSIPYMDVWTRLI